MAEIVVELSLVQEVRVFGGRVFDFVDRLEAVDAELRSTVRGAAASASRHLARSAQASEGRIARRAAELCFKQLSDVVRLLDQAGAGTPAAVDASALAAEATELAERLYDLCLSA